MTPLDQENVKQRLLTSHDWGPGATLGDLYVEGDNSTPEAAAAKIKKITEVCEAVGKVGSNEHK